jgi:hypothetical protein
MDNTLSSSDGIASTNVSGERSAADSTPKSLSLSIPNAAADEQRLDAIAGQNADNIRMLRHVSDSLSEMADEMARTQLLLACEIAAGTVTTACTRFSQKADAALAEAVQLQNDTRPKVRTSSH